MADAESAVEGTSADLNVSEERVAGYGSRRSSKNHVSMEEPISPSSQGSLGPYFFRTSFGR